MSKTSQRRQSKKHERNKDRIEREKQKALTPNNTPDRIKKIITSPLRILSLSVVATIIALMSDFSEIISTLSITYDQEMPKQSLRYLPLKLENNGWFDIEITFISGFGKIASNKKIACEKLVSITNPKKEITIAANENYQAYLDYSSTPQWQKMEPVMVLAKYNIIIAGNVKFKTSSRKVFKPQPDKKTKTFYWAEGSISDFKDCQ